MPKVLWIDRDNAHYAVIVSPDGYINLMATPNSYIVELIEKDQDDGSVYSSSAKNLKQAKQLSVAFGYSLLEDSRTRREKETSEHINKALALCC